MTWLSIVGIGEDGLDSLSPVARTLIDTAQVLIGGKRHLAMLPPARGGNKCERIPWPTPFSALAERIPEMRDRRVCVLATGDPMFYGVGATLSRRVPPNELTIIPSVSAATLAAARLKWPLERVATINMQGRPLEQLSLFVHPGARLLILSKDLTTPAAVAEWLTARGFGDSRLTAMGHMGGRRETRAEGTAREFTGTVPDFHTLAVECVAGPKASWHPRNAGLPDDSYEHDGLLTKREFRALALAKLMPHPGALLWDIGAGCGSIGIEWLRAAPLARAIALEPNVDRRAIAARNATALGATELEIRESAAPDGLASLPAPDAIFIGGGLSEATIEAATEKLKPGGRLVAHVVTLESEAMLLAAHARHGGELVRLSVSRAEPIGDRSGWKPAIPIVQWAWRKP
jgi:precorrin-6B C5,15-methyltransferase / cobalt-precorrin-6B C5,C15-methyltransferase